MKRFEMIKKMSIEDMAKAIVTTRSTDDYCKGVFECNESCDCEYENEVKCCIAWLNEEYKKT